MTPFFIGVAVILGGGLVAWGAGGRHPALGERVYAACAAGGVVLLLIPAVRVLAGGAVAAVTIPSTVPGGPWTFGLDALSAAFLAVVAVVGALAALYGVAYLAPERGHRPLASAHAFTALLLAAMALVVAARAAIPLLIAWEAMALSAYFLVVFERERDDTLRAGLVYLATTHAGILVLFAMFALWGARAGGLGFEALRASGANGLLFGLALAGFGAKAGFVPLHFWLPGAHGAAPSHVSALMSGVMIKTGIYGVLRVVQLAGTPPPWWGWLVLALGILSAVLGVLWALGQHDLKRLLAYHSVENIGIILLGTGVGALGLAYGHRVVAVIGFAGAVLHTVNHALFKSLLFLGAGSVLRATGTRELEHLGGLARRMPWTWAAFLTGSVAIVGLPPLNGLVSEWLVYRALLASGHAGGAIAFAAFTLAALALVGALALACFAKAGGAVFLGHPRSGAALDAAEVGAGFLVPMLGLAAACFAIGLAPMAAVAAAARAAALVANLTPAATPAVVAEVAEPAASLAAVAIGVTVLVVIGGLAARSLRRRRPLRAAETWGCGYARPRPSMQYTASSFAAPILAAFQPLAGVHEERTPDAFRTVPREALLEAVALPGWRLARKWSARLRRVEEGRLQLYVLFIVAAVVGVLVYLWVAGGAA